MKIGDLPNVPRDVVHDRMRACDIALVTSLRESGPVAAREAIACGLPVVSVDVGDLATWLPKRCIAKDTPEALADAVETILEGEVNDLFVPERFEAGVVSKQLEDLFTRLLPR